MIQWEVASMAEPGVCTLWHPEARADKVRDLVRGKVVEITANTVEDALSQVPADLHSPVLEIIRVAVLRAPRQVMDALRERGWHSGHWRDEVTGEDNGVRRLFASTTNVAARSIGLQKIVRVLHDEARKIAGGVVTLWHSDISPDMLQAEDIQVAEIHVEAAEEAMAQWKQALQKWALG
jgi:hypothetical protein